MSSVEVGFAFIVVPLYYLVCVAVARQEALRRAGWPVLFLANWAIAGACFAVYSVLTDLGAGQWLGVALFSGFVAASVGTALAVRLRGTPARGEPEALPNVGLGAHAVMVYHFEIFDGAQMRYVKSGIRATLDAIEAARGKVLMESGRSVPASEVSPSGFLIFGTNG